MTSGSSLPDGAPEFSRPLRVDRLTGPEETRSISATAEECRALADRFHLPSLQALSADIRVRHSSTTGLIRIAGGFEAQVTQICVVTLEEFDATVSDTINLTLSTAPGDINVDVDVVDIDPFADEDDPEPLEGNILDIGEIVAQHVSLALDPHPRKPGAELPGAAVDLEDDSDDLKPNPFRALSVLKGRK